MHEQVPHPHKVIQENETQSRSRVLEFLKKRNDRVLTWLTDHLLASMLMFDLALIVPIMVLIPSFRGFRDVVIILSSNWIQLWALFALQRSQNRADFIRQAKADADHQALTHIAKGVDKILRNLNK